MNSVSPRRARERTHPIMDLHLEIIAGGITIDREKSQNPGSEHNPRGLVPL